MVENWKCYGCKYVGTSAEFDSECPKCNSEDVFPHRIFRCNGCGKTEPQANFFNPDFPLDPDPVEEGWKEPHWSCGSSSWTQVPDPVRE